MKEKYLSRRWNDIFSIVLLIVTAVFVIVVMTGIVEVGFASFTALVFIAGVG